RQRLPQAQRLPRAPHCPTAPRRFRSRGTEIRLTRVLPCSLLQNEAYSDYRVKPMVCRGSMSIGELAKATGVKVVTIRYYEQVKVMPAPARTKGNYRAYKQEHLHRLQFIRRCRELGFTLDQLRDLLRLCSQVEQECAGVDRITARHLKEIEQR